MTIHYTKTHEWVRVEGSKGIVGITKRARQELGDVVHIEFPEVGSSLKAGEEAVIIESTKAAIDITSPVSGIVRKINTHLQKDLSLLNEDPEGRGWLFEVELLKTT